MTAKVPTVYEVKNKLCLFERPFKENKNGVFPFLNIFSRSRDIQVLVQKLMTSTKINHKILNISGNIEVMLLKLGTNNVQYAR